MIPGIKHRALEVYYYYVAHAVQIVDNSLNLAQAHLYLAHLTLDLAASSTPPPATMHQMCHPNSKTWKHIPTLHLVLFQPLSEKHD